MLNISIKPGLGPVQQRDGHSVDALALPAWASCGTLILQLLPHPSMQTVWGKGEAKNIDADSWGKSKTWEKLGYQRISVQWYLDDPWWLFRLCRSCRFHKYDFTTPSRSDTFSPSQVEARQRRKGLWNSAIFHLLLSKLGPFALHCLAPGWTASTSCVTDLKFSRTHVFLVEHLNIKEFKRSQRKFPPPFAPIPTHHFWMIPPFFCETSTEISAKLRWCHGLPHLLDILFGTLGNAQQSLLERG